MNHILTTENYGAWSASGVKPGDRIDFTPGTYPKGCGLPRGIKGVGVFGKHRSVTIDGGFYVQDGEDVRFEGIVCRALRREANPAADQTHGLSLVGACASVTVAECEFHGFRVNVSVSGDETKPARNLRFRDCEFAGAFEERPTHDHKGQGAYFSRVDGLVFEFCDFRNNGYSERWGIPPNTMSHGLYCDDAGSGCRGVALRSCSLRDNASHGAQLRNGGEALACDFTGNAINLMVGGAAKIVNSRLLDPVRLEGGRAWGLVVDTSSDVRLAGTMIGGGRRGIYVPAGQTAELVGLLNSSIVLAGEPISIEGVCKEMRFNRVGIWKSGLGSFVWSKGGTWYRGAPDCWRDGMREAFKPVGGA